MIDPSVGGKIALVTVLLVVYFYVQKAVKESGQEEEVRRMEKKVYAILTIIALFALAIGGLYLSWFISSFS